MRKAAALLLLLPGLALAQTGNTLTLQVGGVQDAVVAADSCDMALQVTWTAQSSGVVGSDLSFWSTASECGDAPGAGDVKYASVSQTLWPTRLTDSFNVVVRDLPIFTQTDGGNSCGLEALEKTVKFCAAFSFAPFFGAQNQVMKVTTPATLTYDSFPPQAPSLEEPVALDRALSLAFSSSADTVQVHFEARAEGEVDFVLNVSVPAGQATARLAGLTNGVRHEVRAIAEDEAGNRSGPSESVAGTPVLSEGFFSIYRREGGAGQGGCAAAGGGASGAIALLVVARLVSRRRRS